MKRSVLFLKKFHNQYETRTQTNFTCTINKPRTAKVGAISKAQNLKGGPFGLCETPAGCKKNFKKLKGGPFGDMEKFLKKKFFIEIFKQCHSAEKCKRGDPLRFFDIHCVAKYRNK